MAEVETQLDSLPLELSENEFSEMINLNIICRLCANQSDKLIGIYSENGINNDLAEKINMYLPIKVINTDNLPLQCCWQCASTVLAWHDLILTCVEADRRLRSYHFVNEKQLEVLSSTFGNEENVLLTTTSEALTAAESISKYSIKYEAIATDIIGDDALQNECRAVRNNENIEISSNNNEDNNIYVSITKDNCTTDTGPTSHKFHITLIEDKPRSKKKDNSGLSNTKVENLYKFQCLYCPNLFISQADVVRHLKLEHPAEDEVILFDETNFKGNINKQGKTKLEKKYLGSTHSKKKRVQKSIHIRHMTKHPLPKIDPEEVNKAKVEVDGRLFYMCKECGKSLHSMYTYVWHTRIHTGERPYVCNLCNKEFRVSQGLVRHLKETHERLKKFECDICRRCFATKRNVEEHRRIHTNERPYVCATCGKSFKQKASLFVHNRSHSSDFPYSCSECPQKFRTKPSMLVHVTKHTGEKPFPCDICGRHFRIKYELKRHKLIHSEEKPFTCKLCRQSFRQKRYLRNHLKLNHNISDPNELLTEYLNAI